MKHHRERDPISAGAMRALEAREMARGRVTGAELMRRAGEGAVREICAHWPDLAEGPATALVLAGPGNNGGDGFVMARALSERGWTVTVWAAGWDHLMTGASIPAGRGPDAQANAASWHASGGALERLDMTSVEALGTALADAHGPVLVIDALLGIGQSRCCDGLIAPVQAALASAAPRDLRRVAVDIPTGYLPDDPEGARCAGRPLASDLVVTFHRIKPVHLWLEETGVAVTVVDIGLPDDPGARDG